MSTTTGTGRAYGKVRVKLAAKAVKILTDTCLLIVGADEYEDTPCEFSGGHNNEDGAPYKIKFAWDSEAVRGAAVIIDEVPGRSQLTLQLVAPIDSSTGVWQEWRATAGPAFGRAVVGL